MPRSQATVSDFGASVLFLLKVGLGQKSASLAALFSPVKHSPWVPCVPSIGDRPPPGQEAQKEVGTLTDTLDNTGDCGFGPLWHGPSHEATAPPPLSGTLRTSGPQCFPRISR